MTPEVALLYALLANRPDVARQLVPAEPRSRRGRPAGTPRSWSIGRLIGRHPRRAGAASQA